MKTKILDPDEKVRQTVCKVYGELDYETAAYHVTEEMLVAIGKRCLDTKVRAWLYLELLTHPTLEHCPTRSLCHSGKAL
jgi:hypothetical protein